MKTSSTASIVVYLKRPIFSLTSMATSFSTETPSFKAARASYDVKQALKSKLTSLSNEIEQTKSYNYKTTAEGGAGWTLEGNYEDKVSEISTYLDNRFAYLDKKFNELANTEDILCGDVNNDGDVDIFDIMDVQSYIEGVEPDIFIFKAADTDEDEDITIFDLMDIIDIVLNN